MGLGLGLAGWMVEAATPVGTITPFAAVPAVPGFPEGVAVDGNRVYVSGPARFGTAGTGPSAIHVYNRNNGNLVTTISVAGEALAFEHAVSNVAVDRDGRIYALSTQLGLIRFRKQGQGYVQQNYGAPVPDLPACGAAAPGQDCSPTVIDLPPLVNDLVFDAHGNAYVTDSLQATIWRYAPGGGAPEIWFQSPLLEGGGFFPFGPNGMRIDPDGDWAYFATTSSILNPTEGTIYRLPLVAHPEESDLEVFHVYAGGEFPDQLAFGAHGKLYVSLALSNQISVLGCDGSELTRYGSPVGAPVPLDNPAGIAFDARTKSLLIVNHALLSGDPSHFAILSLYVKDPGAPLFTPNLP